MPDLPEVMRVYPKLSDYPGLTLKASITSVICFGYKVFGEKSSRVISAWDFKSRWQKSINDDLAVIRAGRKILEGADCVVSWNGKRFDWKYFQTRLMKHGLDPLPKIPHVDLCAVAKSNLYLFNNRLGTVGKFLVDDDKLENGGWDLWVDVFYRKSSALKLMAEYCAKDVELTAKLFKRMRPFLSNVPNYNLFTSANIPLCPNCQSTRIQRRGYHFTKTNSYHRYQCLDCGSWSRADAEDKRLRST